MRRRVRFRLAERSRRVRRIIAVWRRRDPKPWVVALVGMALGLGLFLMALAWVGALRLLAYVAKLLRDRRHQPGVCPCTAARMRLLRAMPGGIEQGPGCSYGQSPSGTPLGRFGHGSLRKSERLSATTRCRSSSPPALSAAASCRPAWNRIHTRKVGSRPADIRQSGAAIDTREMPAVHGRADAVRGKFHRPAKRQLTPRIDADAIECFRRLAANAGYRQMMHHALRAAMSRDFRRRDSSNPGAGRHAKRPPAG